MNQLARMLGKFNVTSQTIRFSDKPHAKGYYKENFAESWERYGMRRSENQDLKGYKVTTAMNTGQMPDSQEVTEGSCNLSKKGTIAKAEHDPLRPKTAQPGEQVFDEGTARKWGKELGRIAQDAPNTDSKPPRQNADVNGL